MSEHIIKVVLIDDHALVRDGIRSLLEDNQQIQVVGEAADGQQGLEVIRETQPDVAIVDIRMPGMSGIDTMKQIPGYSDKTRGMILSMHDSEEYVLNSIQAGARGYLLKDISSDEFVKAIQTVH
ncbi:MAG: response regulator transcription factor, partial [Bacteroidota bacterium]